MRGLSITFVSILIAGGIGAQALSISLPGEPWSLQMNAPGFRLEENGTRPDGRRYLYAVEEASGFGISVTLEKVSGVATLDGCEEVFRGRMKPGGPFQISDEKETRDGDMAIQEYMIHQANGAPVEQKNLFGCMVKGDVFIDIHVSKVAFKSADQARLMALVKSASFVAVTVSESAGLMAEGNKFFAAQEFAKAIGPYQKALELEKKEPKLESAQWRVLVDNLAVGYGVTGKLGEVEELLKYAIAKDPAYPMFYFIYADLSAEKNDLGSTMKYLRLALKYKANVIPGERLPDPAMDDSFKRFMGNGEFRKLTGEFK